jgi:hypothetical protein
MNAFFAGSAFPAVEQFAASDVYRGANFIGRIELYSLEPQVSNAPDLDERVLGLVSTLAYQPGPQTTERLALPGEQVLVRRTPRLVAWTWQQRGVIFNVVADGIDPGEASDFVAVLSAVQQDEPKPPLKATR